MHNYGQYCKYILLHEDNNNDHKAMLLAVIVIKGQYRNRAMATSKHNLKNQKRSYYEHDTCDDYMAEQGSTGAGVPPRADGVFPREGQIVPDAWADDRGGAGVVFYHPGVRRPAINGGPEPEGVLHLQLIHLFENAQAEPTSGNNYAYQ